MKKKLFVLCLLAIACFYFIFNLPPIGQDPIYHKFADKRPWIGIKNFGDVASNIMFLIFGLLGLRELCDECKKTEKSNFNTEHFLWKMFFTSIVFVGFGSAYYHLNPNNNTLVWVRIPITLAFMSLFSVVIAERINKKLALFCFPIFVILGVASVIYWNYTEIMWQGDLRSYILVQLFPMLAMPIIFFMFNPKYDSSYYFIFVFGWYILAKMVEFFDDEVFAVSLQTISGHTLKHIFASMSVYSIICYLINRKRVG